MSIEDRKQMEAVAEAYVGIINEAKESKFKVGDEVGRVSSSSRGQRPGSLYKVHSVDKRSGKATLHSTEGEHVTYADHRGEHILSGGERTGGWFVPKEEHTKLVNDHKARVERDTDLDEIAQHINGATQSNHYGHFTGFTKEHADRLHELIKKHTKAD